MLTVFEIRYKLFFFKFNINVENTWCDTLHEKREKEFTNLILENFGNVKNAKTLCHSSQTRIILIAVCTGCSLTGSKVEP